MVIKMGKLSNQDFIELVKRSIDLTNQGLRVGQSFMISLSEMNNDLYNDITGTDNDCFHEDEKLINFFKYLDNE